MCLLCVEMTKMKMVDIVRAYGEVSSKHQVDVEAKLRELGLRDAFIDEFLEQAMARPLISAHDKVRGKRR